MSISIPNKHTKYRTSCDQILVNPPSCSQIPFPVKIFAFSHIPPHILAKSRIPKILYNTIQYKFYCQLPMGAFQRQVLIVQVIKKKKDPDARQRCKASENTQGTNCIALFFAVIPVHWQHELAQSLLLSCL